MEEQVPTGSEEVLEDLRRELALVGQALEAGTQVARTFFEDNGWEVDRILSPHIVRSAVKRVLEAAGHKVEEMTSEDLANNGLMYHCRRYSVRVLKAQDGVLPAPGPSRRRRAFFNQMPTQQRLDGWATLSGEHAPRIEHVVVCWDVNRDYELVDLYLARPKAGSATQTSAEIDWIIPLNVIDLASNGGPEEEFEEGFEDLPFRRKDAGENEVG